MEGHAAALNMGAGRVHYKLRRRYRAQPSAGNWTFLSSCALPAEDAGGWPVGTSAHHGIGRLTEVGRGAPETCPAVEQDGLHRTGATGHGRAHFHVVGATGHVFER